MSELAGRTDLVRWAENRPTNFFEAAPHLMASLTAWAGSGWAERLAPRLADFGGVVATVIDPAVEVMERRRDLPALRAWDGIGQRVGDVVFDARYEIASAAAWESGLLAADREAPDAFAQAALFFLLSHVGEGGIACPIVCTVGLGRALAHRGDPDLRERYLDRVRSDDYATALRGAQFLTEVQGGSDVGANEVVAREDDERSGAWRLSGEKWFCSVADADLFAVTARPVGAPSGTRGLGCFLVPRTLDGGSPNGFSIRQLKDKLGTRCLASGEIDFDGAVAWPIGPIDRGFHVAVEELLNTSRWLNAVGSTGLMARACLEATHFARHRRAFGRAIDEFPIVREQLAEMRLEERGALASTMALTALQQAIDTGAASEVEVAAHRLLVNANKYLTSVCATNVVHQGIEILGGNGTIETFSVLPRLYRDAVVFESWEGTHNVLCAQVQRDAARLGLLAPYAAWVVGLLEGADGASATTVRSALDAVVGPMTDELGDGDAGAARFRRRLGRLVRVTQAACLLREAEVDPACAPLARAFVARHVVGEEGVAHPEDVISSTLD